MQNAKDTFYITLRNRLAAFAPERTVTLRAVQRPAICVEDAEAPVGELPNDCFVLQWTGTRVETTPCGTLVSAACNVLYASAGSQPNMGLDRGRDLSALDALLMEIFQPGSAQKMNYAVTPATAMQTTVFWTSPSYGPIKTVRDQLSRVVTATVYSYQEPGEQ